jgi:hypothetical protein
MTLVDLGVLGGCDARTQGAPIAELMLIRLAPLGDVEAGDE